MNQRRFDLIARHLSATGSRRETAKAVAAAGLGLGLARLGFASADAKKKKPKPKPKLNEYGCLDVGQKCAGNDALCCSGICGGKKPKKGKKDTRRCVAHNVGGCEAGQDLCATGDFPCGIGLNGTCFRTTGKAGFCGIDGPCQVCQTDADCQVDWGPGAACVVCAGCVDHGGTGCVMAFT